MTQTRQTTSAATGAPSPSTSPENGQVAPSWFEQHKTAGQTSTQPAASTTAQTQAAGQQPHNGASPIGSALIGRTTAGLAVVIIIILAAAWLLKRFGMARGGRPELLKIVAARNVGNRERVVVVEIEDEWLVLGVSAGRVNCLHRRPAGETPPDTAAAPMSRGFADKLAARIAGNSGRKNSRQAP
ncbi:MAG: flagellar biosynthetic protein FliO [Salinisphaera sp.]|jgi:flagellar protein FliO/FliZ|nr:flagellar biosynthetic protein FliO [Salinisphaera sp.]